VAKARAIAGLTENAPYAAVAARVVEVRAAEVAEHATGVLDVGDIERVHDMRVATRRLRAALEVFEPCFPRKPFKAVLKDVKALADALGERRDPDVTIAALEDFAAHVARADQPGVETLIERLRVEQRQANEQLASFVDPKRLRDLVEQTDGLVARARALVPQPQPPPSNPVAERAPASLATRRNGAASR
jgi:CHAD domain-containing protein